MADLALTISNSINCFGPAPTTNWNAFSWGDAKWGEGTESLVKSVMKQIDNSIASDTTLFFDAAISFSNSLSSTFEMSNEELTDGSGYNFVFRRPTVDAETQVITNYTSFSAQNTAWSTSTVSATTWS